MFNWLRNRVQLAAARHEVKSWMTLAYDSLELYEIIQKSGYEKAAEDAEYYKRQAQWDVDHAHAAAEPFGDAAKQKPTIVDSLLVLFFGWLYC